MKKKCNLEPGPLWVCAAPGGGGPSTWHRGASGLSLRGKPSNPETLQMVSPAPPQLPRRYCCGEGKKSQPLVYAVVGFCFFSHLYGEKNSVVRSQDHTKSLSWSADMMHGQRRRNTSPKIVSAQDGTKG